MEKSGGKRLRPLVTALEVLVVLVIIAIAATILFPNYARMRDKARITQRRSSAKQATYRAAVEPAWAAGVAMAQPVGGRVLITTAELSLKVRKAEDAQRRIGEIAARAGGFVASSSVNRGEEGETWAEITIRLPANTYRQALHQIERLGKVESLDEQGKDVTEEYIDLRSRLLNLQAEEARFREILRAGKTVSDLLRVESELWRVRGEIEKTTGRLNYLREHAELATLTVSLHEKGSRIGPPGWSAVGAIREAFQALVATAKVLFSVIVYLVMFLPIWGAAWGAWVIERRRKEKGEQSRV